jgi:CheY-like chemotaxis protein
MAPPLEPGRVLVVDDMQPNRLLARAYLEILGWTVDECASALTTLTYLGRCTPDYILLDIRMPDIDGIALAALIRQKCPVGTVKLIAYTALAQAEEVARIRASGFDGVLIKPVSLEEMTGMFGSRAHEALLWELNR